ncbi:bifunctional (p)ppGpp synthetase/guanosine-3',5'-bis(diphosphate) 3'-pyrophosphohydrolase [Candidatus Berkelbacteria bacterium]|nr:bifunctional (p)ppGpp synthetase/guanosine-3',5'-bis(diphosphate) 3'-pyrophosphohydrolase [Candidatus Berkelbacteria bacterium]
MPRTPDEFATLKAVIASYMSRDDQRLIESAYRFSARAHAGTARQSGEPYVVHPLAVAHYLASRSLDAATIAAALLHDVIEDTATTERDLEREFGPEVASLVAGVTKLGRIRLSSTTPLLPEFLRRRAEERQRFERQVESLRKMLLAMTDDIRVILIKLADRLHNMQTLTAVPEHKRARIAQETLEIYAPLAHRLGMGEMKGQLEDLAFPYVYPAEQEQLQAMIGPKIQEREQYILRFQRILRAFLESEEMWVIDVHGRVKHLYSLWRKLNRYEGDLAKIYDLVAIRIILPDPADCYQALGLVHSRWNPLLGRIKDYIATPKPNGYRSLHTTVFGPDGEIVEVQIRTPEMHEHAEYGIAAHWHYAEGRHAREDAQEASQTKLEWLQELHRWQESLKDPKELKKVLHLDFFSDQIFVFTPQGDVIKLPAGSTPIDFAYAVHSDIGNATTGAKVDGRLIPLRTPLKNGDIVEILSTKASKGPKRDWLKFVKTQKARTHIKAQLHLAS